MKLGSTKSRLFAIGVLVLTCLMLISSISQPISPFSNLPSGDSVIQIEQPLPTSEIVFNSLNYTYSLTSSLWGNSYLEIIDLCFKDEFVYVLKETSENFQEELVVVDLSDLTNPVITDSYQGFVNPFNMAYKNGHLLVADATQVKTIEVQGSSIGTVDFFFEFDYVSDVLTTGNYAVFATYNGLLIYDILDLPQYNLYSDLLFSNEDSTIANFALSPDDILFVARADKGIAVVDLTTLFNPVETAYLTRSGSPMNVCYNNSLFFVAEFNYGLSIFNASNPSSPQVISSYYGGGHPKDVCVYEEKIFLAEGSNGIEIVDGRNSSDLTQLMRINLGNDIHKVFVRNDIIYALDVKGGLYILSKDSDMDGLSDITEMNQTFTNPFEPDSDFDGLSDYSEIYQYQTDPLNSDSDTDGYTDFEEISNGWDPNNPYNPEGLYDDPDLDGLTNAEEYLLGTDLHNADSDFDTLKDGDEVHLYETDPLNDDCDDDQLFDGEEVLIYYSNPWENDTDADNIGDFDEAKVYFTNPTLIDTDKDSYSDYDELFLYDTNPLKRLSNPDMEFFLQYRLPIIISVLILLGLGAFLSVKLRARIRLKKYDKLCSQIDSLLPGQTIAFLEKIKLPLSDYLMFEAQINTLSEFLFNHLASNKYKLPSKKKVETFLAENNLSSDILESILSIIKEDLFIDYSLLDLEIITSLNDFTKSFLSSLSYEDFSRKGFTILPAIFSLVGNSLINCKIVYHFILDCNNSTIDQEYYNEIRDTLFNFEEDGCQLIRYLWQSLERESITTTSFLHIMKYLQFGALNTIALLEEFSSLDYSVLVDRLTKKQTQDSSETANKQYHSSSAETISEYIHDHWKIDKKEELAIGEVASKLNLNNLTTLYHGYLLFIQKLITTSIESFSNIDGITLTYTPPSLSELSSQTKKFLSTEKLVKKLQKLLVSLSKETSSLE